MTNIAKVMSSRFIQHQIMVREFEDSLFDEIDKMFIGKRVLFDDGVIGTIEEVFQDKEEDDFYFSVETDNHYFLLRYEVEQFVEFVDE